MSTQIDSIQGAFVEALSRLDEGQLWDLVMAPYSELRG